MELSQLEAFLEAVRRGSFRRAAEALLLSQPSVSTRIQRLEDELRVPLFHRMARGVRLTDMGRTFLPFAQRSIGILASRNGSISWAWSGGLPQATKRSGKSANRPQVTVLNMACSHSFLNRNSHPIF